MCKVQGMDEPLREGPHSRRTQEKYERGQVNEICSRSMSFNPELENDTPFDCGLNRKGKWVLHFDLEGYCLVPFSKHIGPQKTVPEIDMEQNWYLVEAIFIL